MNPVQASLPAALPTGYVENAALYAAGLLTVEDLAAAHHMDVGTALAWLADPEVAADVDARAVVHRQSGKFARAQAGDLLTSSMSKLQALVDGGELSAATLVRIADIAARVSGLLAPDKSEPVGKTAFSVVINLTERPAAKAALKVIDAVTGEVADE